MTTFDEKQVRVALRHLRSVDPVMKQLIRTVGPFTLVCDPDPFRMLVSSIVSQQISTKAARSIRDRLEKTAGGRKITPARLAALTPEQMQQIGLSRQKAAYLSDLAAHITSGALNLRKLRKATDLEILTELTAVRGIGVWTAQMFLIFCLGRPDVFPPDDFGIRAAIRNVYGLPELPDKKTACAIAAVWSPYSTIASWYLWRSLDKKSKSTV